MGKALNKTIDEQSINRGNFTPADYKELAKSNTKPTAAQKKYLLQGLSQPGGKLPLFDKQGQQIPVKTIKACIIHGWAEPWFRNPVKPDWLVCKLTEHGKSILK